jgi:hypothetical protein
VTQVHLPGVVIARAMERMTKTFSAILHNQKSPALLLCLVLGGYILLYFNRYAPITEGWFIAFAKLMQSGQKPYQDFELLLPPLYTLQTLAFREIVGDNLFWFRLAGLPVTVGIGLALYKILEIFFDRWVCAFSAAVSTIYYQSGVAFIGYDFTQFLTLYQLIGFLFVLRFWSVQHLSNFASHRYLYLAGVFFGLAILTKHSNGGVTAAFVIVATGIVVLRFSSFSLAVRRGCWMAAGVLTPFLPIAVWLTYQGLWVGIIANTGSDALQAKGGAGLVFGAWINFLLQQGDYNSNSRLFLGVIALSCIIFCISTAGILIRRASFAATPVSGHPQQKINDPEVPDINDASQFLLLLSIASLAGIALLLRFGSRQWFDWIIRLGDSTSSLITAGAFNLYVIGAIIAAVGFLWRRSTCSANWFLLLSFGVGLMFANGTSSQNLSEISTFVGLGIIVAAFLTLGTTISAALLPTILLSIGLSAFDIAAKFETPYSWWLLKTGNVMQTICEPANAVMNGLCFDPGELAKITSVVDEIQKRTDPNDPIYVFPHMPIFNLISGRAPFANAVESWYDFMSDRTAEKVAELLLSEPPKVIVFANLPSVVAEEHEKAFRSNKVLGQRRIIDAIGELRDRKIIKAVLNVPALNNVDIIVYARQF